jgi:hypothetical protein
MTRQTLSFIFLILFLQTPDLNSIKPASAIHDAPHQAAITMKTSATGQADHSAPVTHSPAKDVGFKSTEHKIHLLKIEELAKIHRFHKERVKKIKRHHHKYWTLAKAILVVCHLALLISAFLHLTH